MTTYSQAKLMHCLGMLTKTIRRFDESEKYYESAIGIFIEFGSLQDLGGSYYGLGTIAHELKEFEKARNYYNKSFEIFTIFSEHHSQARVYHNLGAMSQQLNEFDEAIVNYIKAIEIYVQLDDKHLASLTLRNCAYLYKSHPSPHLLSTISQVLNISGAEVLQLFEDVTA